MFCKNVALKNFAKFTEKHLYQSLSFIKVAGLCFPVNFAKVLKNTFYKTPPMAASEYYVRIY